MMKRVILKMRKIIISMSNYKSTRMALALMRMNKKMRRMKKSRKKKMMKKKRRKKKRRKNKRTKMSIFPLTRYMEIIMRVTMRVVKKRKRRSKKMRA